MRYACACAGAAVLVVANLNAALGQGPVVTTATWTSTANTGATWADGANWDSNPNYPSGVGAAAIFNNNQTANRTITLGSDITVGSMTVNLGSSTFTNTFGANASPSILTFDAAGDGPATLTSTGNPPTTAANPIAIRGPVVLNDDLVITLESVNSNISANVLNFIAGTLSGPGGITKNGAGVLSFADNQKEFEGPLVVNQGRVRFNSGARVPILTESVYVGSGGQIVIEASGATGTLTFGRDRPDVLGQPIAPITLNGFGIAPFPGAIRTGSGLTQTLTNPITLESDAAIDVISISPTAIGQLTLSNVVSGPGKLIANYLPGDPNRGGELVLTNTNTYTGGTRVDQGWIVLSGAAATLGTGDVLVDGASTQVGGVPGSNLFAGVLRIMSDVVNGISDTATLSLTGDGGGDGIIGGRAELGAGVSETIGGLVLGGVAQTQAGTYGSTSSGATFQNDAYFMGSGVINLVASAVNDADFDNDSDVDGEDFLIWQRGVGVGTDNSTGDADGSGTVTGADLEVWKTAFGTAGAAAAIGAIPEPAGMMLALASLPLALRLRRKR